MNPVLFIQLLTVFMLLFFLWDTWVALSHRSSDQ